jgi:hypothetical protein
MNPAVVVYWLSWLVQSLPAPLLAALDAWSRDAARRRAEQRRRQVGTRTDAVKSGERR